MDSEYIELCAASARRTPTLRDMVRVFFRHWHVILVTFSVIVVTVCVYTLVRPRTYEAETEILVKRERADPIVTPDSNASPRVTQAVTEEDLNSEVQLLQSRDLLEAVVIARGLDRTSVAGGITGFLSRLGGTADSSLRVPLAVRALQRKLKVSALGKTNLLKVTYESRDPKLAADVLRTLTDLYLKKHLEVHRPPGTFDFFQEEAMHYRDGLHAAEENLVAFNRQQNTVSAQTEKTAAQQKLAEFESNLRQLRSTIAATQGRIQSLTAEMTSTPARLTTQIRTNSLLLQQLRSTLLTLQLKRTEMNGKYAANYIVVQNLDSQIAETKAAIAQQERQPLHDDTTDRNSTYQWMSDELAKARTDLVSLKRQEAAMDQQIRSYRAELLALDVKDVQQQDLLRTAKMQEANYLLYQNKREEARISDALDEKHIVNVTVAEQATIPALPSGLGPFAILAIGVVVATLASCGIAFSLEHFTSRLPSPLEVTRILETPVLACFPTSGPGESYRAHGIEP
jgi:uncharacterized protein involved in exopolysaccharide biosynthesis